MIELDKIPCLVAHFELLADAKERPAAKMAPVPEYVRAPLANGAQATGGRPPATQRGAR